MMIEALRDEVMVDVLASSQGLCLPQLRMAFQMVKDEQDYQKLLSLAYEKLSSLDNGLAEFIRKNDYHFLPEGFGPEGDSWKRGVVMSVGNQRAKG